MIGTVFRIFWLNLRRDRVAWLLSFVVPVIFFSIFAVILGGMGSGGSANRIRVALVDDDQSSFSKRLTDALTEEPGLRVYGEKQDDKTVRVFERQRGEQLVKDGNVAVAIVIPKGLEKKFADFTGKKPAIELVVDSSNPIASHMVGGLLQKVVMTAAPDMFMESGIGQLKRWGGPLTDQQKKAIETGLKMLKKGNKKKDDPGDKNTNAAFSGMVPIKKIDLLGQDKANPMIAFYAAATAVMFLLFMCANAAGGSLIEEVESGTLDRLLSTNLTMEQLLVGKWVSITIFGVLQVTVMFVWAALVFRIDLLGHLPGFAIMTVITSAAGSAFGLILGTLCRTRGQLAGVSTTVILIMSALGGSMFPRVLMSENLQRLGLLTFNGWALDGYIKIFWRDGHFLTLWPQVLVLAAMTVVFLILARLLARRWEMV